MKTLRLLIDEYVEEIRSLRARLKDTENEAGLWADKAKKYLSRAEEAEERVKKLEIELGCDTRAKLE